MYSLFRSGDSKKETREDTAEKTLTRLSAGWSTGRAELVPVKEEVEFSFQKPTSDKTDEVAFQMSEKTARQTLSRLSKEWSGQKATGLTEEQDAMLENTKLEAVLSADGKVKLNQIDEEVAPYLLVDWKIWIIKIAVLILIPVALVMGGGIQHVADLYPNLAEYCHSQALVAYKTLPFDNSTNSAYSHLALAKIHKKQKRYSQAIAQAHSAANLYAIDCMTKMDRIFDPINISRYSLGKPLLKLRESLVLAADTANEAGYDTLANKYWRLAMKLDPTTGLREDEIREAVENRKKASNSLAVNRQETDSIEALQGALRLLPSGGASAIYNCSMGYNVSSTDIEYFKRAIDLHLRLARLQTKYNHGLKAYQEISTANVLRKHLIHYQAVKELNNNWNPKNLAMGDVYVSFNVGVDGHIWDLRAVGVDDIIGIREAVTNNLKDKFNWRKEAADLNALADDGLTSTQVQLIFTRRGVTVPRAFQDGYMKSDLFDPRLVRTIDYRPTIQEISQSL